MFTKMVCTNSSFYFEEIFNLIEKSSLAYEQISNLSKDIQDEELVEKWQKLHKIKQEANIAIEEKRSSKNSSSRAEIEIHTNEQNFKILDNLDLAEYFITSKATLFKDKGNKNDTIIKVKKANGEKCPRCWKILASKCVRCGEFL